MSDLSVGVAESVSATVGRRGFSSFEGKPFPVCWLRTRKDNTKPTKEEAYKAFIAHERGESSGTESVIGKTAFREGQEMEQRGAVGFVETTPAEDAVVHPTSNFLGIKWRLSADQYNIILYVDKHPTYHPTIEAAFEKLRRLAENRMLGEKQSTCSFAVLKEIGAKVQLEFQRLLNEPLKMDEVSEIPPQ